VSLHTIIPGTLYGAAGWLRGGAQPITWLPPDLNGWLPVTAYALTDGAEWMAMDTGLPVHWPVLRPALEATLGATTRRRMVNTRREQDCMANLHAMTQAFGITEVPYVGVLNPLELMDWVEAAEAHARIEAMAPVRAMRIEVGQMLEVGSLRLEPLRVQLRLLATNWFYEHATRSLFTSESFGFLTRDDPGQPLLRDPGEAPFYVPAIAGMLSAKFDWLIGIDPSPILADLDTIFAARKVDRICPCHGCVIEGPVAVAEAVVATQSAIRLLAGRVKPVWSWPATP